MNSHLPAYRRVSFFVSYYINNMDCFDSVSTASATRGTDGAASDFATRNLATTAGLVAGAGTIVAGGALLTAALPVQMIAATTGTGVLLYVGHRQANGLSPLPGMAAPDAKSDAKSDTVTEPATEVAPAAA